MKNIGRVLAIIQFVLAIRYFDWSSWNRIIVSILLFSGGIIAFFTDTQSEFLIKIKKAVSFVAVFLAVILVVKILFFD